MSWSLRLLRDFCGLAAIPKCAILSDVLPIGKVMLRWRLTLGLLATLVILLLVGIYGVWLFNDLGRAVDNVLRNNYDSIAACHAMRVATARVNTFYPRVDRPAPPYDQTGPIDEAEKEFAKRFTVLERNARDPEQRDLVAQLKQVATDYVQAYRLMFAQFKANDLTIKDTRAKTPKLTLQITELTEKILQQNERQMFLANQAARRKARESIRLLLTAMVSSVVVFVFTYARLGQSLVTPLQKLTDSIRELRSRDFDRALPEMGKDELGELTREFNQMALELRNFYRETDRKLIELNQVIRAMLTTLPYPLFILDQRDLITRMNPAAEKLMVHFQSRGELPPTLRRQVTEAAVTGPDYRLDDLKQALRFRIDEEEIYFLPRIFSLVLEDGSIFGRALMLIDVTRFRWLDEMKSDTLATLSHEIKTPLTGIRLVLHLLLDKRMGALSESQKELVTTARDDCERLLRTLKSLLDLAQMESGKAQLNFQPVSPAKIVEETCTNFRDLGEAAALELKMDLGPGLPNVAVDPDRVGLILSNFVSNALKYSFRDSQIIIRARLWNQGFVRFSVINHGPGLSEIEQSKVFDKFYRSEKLGGDGAGLGLSIARQIVQAHEGRIGVFSVVDETTEFYCDLPVAVLPSRAVAL
jgi:two-component system, NtrC family, sensor histidine kinase KinB